MIKLLDYNMVGVAVTVVIPTMYEKLRTDKKNENSSKILSFVIQRALNHD